MFVSIIGYFISLCHESRVIIGHRIGWNKIHIMHPYSGFPPNGGTAPLYSFSMLAAL